MPKIRRAPQYLKEISYHNLGSQGDYADEWDYAQYASGNSFEDWNRAQEDPNSNYLGWWKRMNRTVFYFGDHRRSYSDRELWDYYDWYYSEARKLNEAIDAVNGLPDIDVSKATAYSGSPDMFYYPKVVINPPRVLRNAVGIKSWLDNKANEVNEAINDYNTKVQSYIAKQYNERQQIESERRKAEEKRRQEEYQRKIREKTEEKNYWNARFTNLESKIDVITNDLEKQKAENKNEVSFLKSGLSGIAKNNNDLASQTVSIQSLESKIDELSQMWGIQKQDLTDIKKAQEKNKAGLFHRLKEVEKGNQSGIEKIRKELEMAAQRQNNVQQNFNKTMLTKQDNTKKFLTYIHKKLDDNSVMFANEKKKLLGEIKAIKDETGNVQPRLNVLSSELTALTKKHDAVKTELLGKLKEQQVLNQTQFEKLNAENEARGKQYDKDTAQLRRDLDVTRAGLDIRDREIARLQEESNIAQNAFQEQEQRHKASFKVLWDYHQNTNRQIKKQNQNKRTTKAAEMRKTQPDMFKRAFGGNLLRGRWFQLVQEF